MPQKDPQTTVWIELQRPESDEQGEQIAAKANNMLTRLNDGRPPPRIFSYNPKSKRFDFGDAMTSIELVDDGHWFNLDYLGRPLGS